MTIRKLRRSRRSFALVSTFNEAGYEKYARQMIETFVRYWPKDVTLYCYCESFLPAEVARNVRLLSLEDSCPSLVAFKERHRENPRAHGLVRLGAVDDRGKPIGIGFRWDAVRFSHKVYSVAHAGRTLSEDVMFWVDADTITFERVPRSFVDGLLPADKYLCYLGREHFTECGFVGYNLKHEQNQTFMARFQQYYDEDLVFGEAEWQDDYIFDVVRREFEAGGLIESRNLTPGNLESDHAFINSELGNYLDHLKGRRKDRGRSSAKELEVHKDHPYWRS